jgi:hypothetical protein
VTNGVFKESSHNSQKTCDILWQKMPWLSKRQAAKYLGVCESTIDNLESRMLLRGYRIYLSGKKPIVRYKLEDLEALFERKPKGRSRERDVIQPDQWVASGEQKTTF